MTTPKNFKVKRHSGIWRLIYPTGTVRYRIMIQRGNGERYDNRFEKLKDAKKHIFQSFFQKKSIFIISRIWHLQKVEIWAQSQNVNIPGGQQV